jgi:predicted site-specific integrase-resolvase
MDTYLTLPEAAKLANRPAPYLNQLAQVGKIKSIQTKTGEVLVSEQEIKELQKESFEDLAGVPIGIGEAARKYGVPQQTISRWKSKGYIRELQRDGQKILLDESDVARQVYNYRLNPGQGRWTVRKSNDITD